MNAVAAVCAASGRTATASRGAGAAAVALPAAIVGGLGFAEGGYWPTAWGWSALALAWVVLLAALLRRELELGTADVVYAGALAVWLAWLAASVAWSEVPGRTVLEFERGLVYLSGVAAILLLARRGDVVRVSASVWAGATAVAGYALTVKLRPGSLTSFDSVVGYRLAEPIGYWNGLGMLCALALVLAVGLAMSAGRDILASSAAASVPLLATALFFTYSRGAWLALALGLGSLVAFEHRRMHAVSVALAVGIPAAIAVTVAARTDALTELGTPLTDASQAGGRLALVIVLAAGGAVGTLAAQRRLVRRAAPAAQLRLLWPTAVTILALATVALVVHAGGPSSLGKRARDAFVSPPPTVSAGDSANRRLWALSGSSRETQWRVALDQARDHPITGEGGGTFEARWLRDRPVAAKVRDAHSLYLETLGELGVTGLALLLLALAVPVCAAARVRREPGIAAAAGAYVAFLAHAGADWDWELPAVTLAALLCGAAVVASARATTRNRRLGTRARTTVAGAAICGASLAAAGLLGNSALSAAWTALENGASTEARRHAETARRWSTWSVEPLRVAAAADAADGRTAAAVSRLREATDAEPANWNVWFDLAQLTQGAERAGALRRALELNPRSPEIAAFVDGNALRSGSEPRR